MWQIAAVLTSPVASAWAWHRQAGTGLSAGTIRLGPVLLGELPWPAGSLDAAVRALRADDVPGCGTAVFDAYAVESAADRDALLTWWLTAVERIDHRARRHDLIERIRSGQPGDPAIIQSRTKPDQFGDVRALRQRPHAPVGGVGDRARRPWSPPTHR